MTQTTFVGYDTATGRVRWTGSCDSAYVANQPFGSGQAVIDTGSPNPVDQNANYISGGAVTAKAACPVSASVAGRVVTLTGVPSGAAYTIGGAATLTGTADATGTLALTFGAAGMYTVAVTCFPAVDYSGSFTLS